MNESPEIKTEYLEQIQARTLRGGRVFGAIAGIAIVYFVFQDIFVLNVPAEASAFRTIGVLCIAFFLLGSFTFFRDRPEWILPAHIAQISAVLVQICGFTCVLFYTRPDLPTYPYGTTSGIIICMLAAFVFAYGARRVLWAVLIIPLVITVAFLLLFCSPTSEEMALFLNPIAICPALIAVAISQERTAFSEFRMRRLALAREAELRVAAEALKATNQDLEHFSRAASHDLRQPLTSMIGLVDLIRLRLPGNYPNQAETEAHLELLAAAANRMNKLVNEILAYSQLGAGEKNLALTDMNAVLEEALQNLDHVVQNTHAEVRRQPLPPVLGNATLLVTVFQNLIDNAIKYCEGNATPEIDVSVEPVGKLYRFCVRDNGIGFDSAFKEEVFEPFHRLHSSDEYVGTGMGLASCSKIVKQHGGTISATSEPGVGSSFCFTLPAAE